MENLMRIKPDKERARSLVKLAQLRFEKIKTFNEDTESSLIIEGFYEICKELITSILFADGYKTLGHKELIEYVKEAYSQALSQEDIQLLDQLRKLRNSIVYYGEMIDPSYIKRNKSYILDLINNLFNICEGKLK